jgi:NTP pyrophosphatase (non-canonical NTP hydrolase)
VTTISEQETIQTRVQEAEGAAGGNLDKVRDLLFGGQMRDYDRKFARLEERLVKETTELRDDVKKRLAALEAYMKAEVESLSDRLRAEQDSRAGGAKDLARELRDVRQQLHAQHQELGDDIRQRVEDVLARLAQEAHELRTDKADRSALAALLTEMAMRLTGELRATTPEDAVRG